MKWTMVIAMGALAILPAAAWAQTDSVLVKSTDGATQIQRMVTTTSTAVGALATIRVEQSRFQLSTNAILNVGTYDAATDVAGDLRYTAGTGELLYYDGSVWQTLAKTSSTTSGYVLLGPAAAQAWTTANVGIFLNENGASTPNLLQLQSTTTDRFVVSNSGAVTTGTWNGTAISTTYGGTGQNWGATAAGNVPYFTAAGTMGLSLAPAAAGYYLRSSSATAMAWSLIQGGDLPTVSAPYVLKAGDTMTGGLYVNYAAGAALRFANGGFLQANNTAAVAETFLWPRWTDNNTYFNFGSGGNFYIRNNASANRLTVADTIIRAAVDIGNSSTTMFQGGAVTDWLRIYGNNFTNGIAAYTGLSTDGGLCAGAWSLQPAGQIYATSNVRTPIFYDSDNTAYYVDPASDTNTAANLAGGISVDGNVVIDNGAGWHRTYGATGWYNGTYGGGWFMQDASFVRNYNGKQTVCSAGNTNGYGTVDATNTDTTLNVAAIGLYGASYNNSTIFLSNSGVQAVGGQYGVMGLATPAAPALAGGYFGENDAGNFARVAYYTGYKIIGSGAVSTTKITSKGRVTLHGVETPGTWFEDVGIAKLVNGRAEVKIDPTFLEVTVIDAAHPFLVFVQPMGEIQNSLKVVKHDDAFEIIEMNGGTSNGEVSWRLLASWEGHEDHRFEEAPGPAATDEDPDGVMDIAFYLDNMKPGDKMPPDDLVQKAKAYKERKSAGTKSPASRSAAATLTGVAGNEPTKPKTVESPPSRTDRKRP